MAKGAKKRRKRHVQANHGTVLASGDKSASHPLFKMLELVSGRWEALVSQGRMQKVELKVKKSGDNGFDAMWEFYDSLSSAKERQDACAIQNAGRLSLLECAVKQAQLAHKDLPGPCNLCDGLFLALQSPGRDEGIVCAVFRSWDELAKSGAAGVFRQPPVETDGNVEALLLENCFVHDVEHVGSRAVVVLKESAVGHLREWIEVLLGLSVPSGRLACAPVRPSDETEPAAASPEGTKVLPPQNEKQRLPNMLYSGSLASFVAFCMLEALYNSFKQRTAPHIRFAAPLYNYLETSIRNFCRDDAGSKHTTFELPELFKTKLSEWSAPTDQQNLYRIESLITYHARRVADELKLEAEATEASRRNSTKSNHKQRIAPASVAVCAVENESDETSVSSQEDEHNDSTKEEQGVEEGNEHGYDDNGSIGFNDTASDIDEKPSMSLSGLTHNKQEGGGENSCPKGRILEKAISPSPSFVAMPIPQTGDSEPWEQVPIAPRRARKQSLSMSGSTHGSRSTSPTAGTKGLAVCKPSTTRRSQTSLEGIVVPPRHNRKRDESADTMSLASVTSTSTILEDNQTPPSKMSHLNSSDRMDLFQTTENSSSSPPSSPTARASSSKPQTVTWTSAQRAVPVGTVEPEITTPLPNLHKTVDAMGIEGVQPSITQRLDHDIAEMAAMLDQVTERRRPWQLAVTDHIKRTVAQLFPGATTTVFGSLATGLAAPCSDVDLIVRNLTAPTQIAIRVLVERLRHESWVLMIQAVERAAVPVIRLSTAVIPISFGNQGSLINVDITFDAVAHRGLQTCSFVTGLLHKYPPLKALTVVLKQFLVEKGLNDPFVGGLSSYGLVIMITAILERHFPQGISPDQRVLGAMFVYFLREYCTPEFTEVGVWLNGGMPAQNERLARMVHSLATTSTAPMYILDPLDMQNNIGRTCFGVHQVVNAFSEASDAIRVSAVGCPANREDWSILGSVFSTGHHRHVVSLVTQVWCPRENPVSTRPAMTTREWSIMAKSVLETLEHKGRVCPWCMLKPHAASCTLRSLLTTFDSLPL